MSKIRSTAEAVSHLFPFRGNEVTLRGEIDRLLRSGELELDRAQLHELCAFWKVPAPELSRTGAHRYGEGGASSVASKAKVTGAQGAQLEASSFGAPPSIAWSDFALGRHKPGTGHAYFKGSEAELLELVKGHWGDRVPGQGRTNLDEVVIVPLPAERFMTTTVKVAPSTELTAELYRRRATEEPYIRVMAKGQAESAAHAAVVLYAKETLAQNSERSTQADWEVVSVIASPVEKEPMDPFTMARNMLGMTGGSQVDYSARDLAEAIVFWAQHTKVGG